MITPASPELEALEQPSVGSAAPEPAAERSGAASQPQDEGRKLQELIEKTEAIRDPASRALVQDCIASVLRFHGESLGRALKIIQDCGPDGRQVLDQLSADGQVRALLLIHGLHPVDLPTRLQQAIEKVRPYMESHGGNVELLSLENDFARFRLQGACKTCPSSSVTLELALRSAIEENCPDLAGFAVEGVDPPQPNGHTQCNES